MELVVAVFGLWLMIVSYNSLRRQWGYLIGEWRKEAAQGKKLTEADWDEFWETELIEEDHANDPPSS